MLIKLTKTGRYKDFATPGGMKAQHLDAGATVDFPDDYANYLVTQGLAEPVAQVEKPAEPAPVGWLPDPVPVEWATEPVEAQPPKAPATRKRGK